VTQFRRPRAGLLTLRSSRDDGGLGLERRTADQQCLDATTQHAAGGSGKERYIDISGESELEQLRRENAELWQRNVQLEGRNRKLEEFVHVSHELQTKHPGVIPASVIHLFTLF
jgi:hypothetical protein